MMKLRIRSKVAGSFILVVLLLVSMSVYSIRVSREFLLESVSYQSQSLAEEVLARISDGVLSYVNALELFMDTALVRETLTQSNAEFEALDDLESFIEKRDKQWRLNQGHRSFAYNRKILSSELALLLRERFITSPIKRHGVSAVAEVFITNRFGANIAQTGPTTDYRQNDEAWWNEARLNGLHIGAIEYDESSNSYGIPIALKINEKGEFLGVSKAVVSLFELIKQVEIYSKKHGSREITIVSGDGKLIYNTGTYRFLSDMSEKSFFKAIQNGKNGFTRGDRFIVHGSLPPQLDYAGFGWILVISYKLDDVLKPVILLQNRFIFFSMVLIGVTMMIAFLVASRIVRPIERLKKAAVSIGLGNLTPSLNIKTDDELEELANTFLDMASRLKDSRDSMNRLISEKEEHALALEHSEKQLMARQDELKKAKDAAETANYAKSEFLANMSHEIRTPLNAVTGFSELLSSLVSDEKQKSYLAAIKTAGKSLLILINDILDLSKIEAGRMEIKCSPVNPQFLISEIRNIFKMKITEKELQFIVEIDKELPAFLLLDETRLRQLLLNLVGNAVKFTEKGFIKLTLKTKPVENVESKVDFIIIVADSGIGIPSDQQEHIFESFKQQEARSTSRFGGTGLGLSICKKLVEMMDGQVTVKSQLGKGSTFEITIRNVAISSEIPPVEEEDHKFENVIFERAKVLVVDDVESNRQLLKELLTMVNLDVLTSENGQQALMIVEGYKPDIIIMDIIMPVMDGIEATKQLKAKPATKKIPVIALSASTTSREKAEILRVDFAGYLTKPVSTSGLISALRKYLKYTLKEKQSEKSKHQAVDRTGEDVVRPAELTLTLKNEILPVFQTIKTAMIMSDIMKFGEKTRELGKRHNVRSLIEFGQGLSEFAQIFDIPGIEKKFHEFPELTGRLLRILGDSVES